MTLLSDDFYYKKAKYSGFRSRASFKLLELNDKFKFLKKGQLVVDLGAAPGGWSQIAAKKVGNEGLVLAIDKAYMEPFKETNITILHQDIMNEKLGSIIKESHGFADVLISDCAPNISGQYGRDHSIQTMLAERALNLCQEILKEGGSFVCKLFQGSETQEFVKETKNLFEMVKLFKPKASRKKSSEIYLFGSNFLGEN
ncbi:RlmE family RNA methyltransferase [Candidatus Heimdallarchaeota archaeon]|nr:MAG: RlmE family RNA methyltransferase [Candidatus Heimdallarchaeota archaeon]